MNVIFGGGGFAREVAWLLDEITRTSNQAEAIDAYVIGDDNTGHSDEQIDGAPVILESDFFARHRATPIRAFLGVGSPAVRRQIHEKCKSLQNVDFPALVHPSVLMDRRKNSVHVGSGAIICAGTILTTSVRIGGFTHLNLGCTIGHDVSIGDFCTLSPGVHVSGRVEIGEGTFIGTGAVLLENIRIQGSVVIGAGATVVHSITEPGTYVGTPARRRR